MRFDRRQHCLVEIVCDDGTTGWGECLGPAKLNAAVVEAYGARLLGRNPLETEKLWQELYNLFRDQGQRGLAVTALLAKLGAPRDVLSFVGNVAGAHLVAELGNRSPLERVALSKHITSLLK